VEDLAGVEDLVSSAEHLLKLNGSYDQRLAISTGLMNKPSCNTHLGPLFSLDKHARDGFPGRALTVDSSQRDTRVGITIAVIVTIPNGRDLAEPPPSDPARFRVSSKPILPKCSEDLVFNEGCVQQSVDGFFHTLMSLRRLLAVEVKLVHRVRGDTFRSAMLHGTII